MKNDDYWNEPHLEYKIDPMDIISMYTDNHQPHMNWWRRLKMKKQIRRLSMTKWIWIAYGMMWLSVSIAISVGIYFTHRISCLWFFIIPSLMSFKSDKGDKE